MEIDGFVGDGDGFRRRWGWISLEMGTDVAVERSNDFINNYLMPVYNDSWKYNDQTSFKYLMETLHKQLLVLSTTGKCKERANKLSLSFSKAASKLLVDLETQLPNASFKLGDAYDVVDNVIRNPYRYGFDNVDSPCCSLRRIRPALTCTPASTLCRDRTKYAFWVEYHPSDSANELIAKELIKIFGFMGGDSPTPAPESAIAPSPSDE
ncbi:GDSL esterase/lipase [Hibiscus syriacus]|uniref:GDSL esterase/lipase n=1 Tax=Hibiscus syriacus TaxID=106335 RepID=A0A6A2ZQA7_HIBSY|nr:GDSL esterase/lipase [Hibiscus syriacus]